MNPTHTLQTPCQNTLSSHDFLAGVLETEFLDIMHIHV